MIEVNETRDRALRRRRKSRERKLHDVVGLIEFAEPLTVSEALSSSEAAD
jgi:hypothetical protein